MSAAFRTDRREFLRLVSTAALGAAVIALPERSAFGAGEVDPLLAVGYAAALPANGAAVRLTDGRRPTGGDRVIAGRPVRLKTDAVYASGNNRSRFNFELGFSIGAKRFWTASRHGTSAPMSFRMPAESGDLSLIVQRLGSGVAESALTISRTGVYVVAFRETSRDAAPNWSRLAIVRDAKGRIDVPELHAQFVVLSVMGA